MLKIDFKKMAHLLNPLEIEQFITKNFFVIKTTDVIRLRKLSRKIWQDNKEFVDKLNATFLDKKSVMSLAFVMLQRTYGSDIQVSDVMASDKYFDAFWGFARKIVEYKCEGRANSRRAKRKYLTTHK